MAAPQSVPAATLGLAAEFAVASELCRRGFYAQLTLGNFKRTDLLVLSAAGKFSRIEVKAKQGSMWPTCRGIHGRRVFLVFVDFAGKSVKERPDFYVLTAADWLQVLKARVTAIRRKNPGKKIRITPENVSVFPDQITKSGNPYRGMSIRPKDITVYREKWGKIERSVVPV